LPTVREILVCGLVSAAALGVVGVRLLPARGLSTEQNVVIEGALRDERRSVIASVTRIEVTTRWNRVGGVGRGHQ
jgi:hypothetical protein